MFDADADTLLDSLALPDLRGTPFVFADPLRPRFMVSSDRDVLFFSAENLQPQGAYTVTSTQWTFTHRTDEVFGSTGGRGGIVEGESILYDPADFTVLFRDTLGLSGLQLDEQRRVIFGRLRTSNSSGSLVRSDLAAYDYANRRLHKIWMIDPDFPDEGFFVWGFHVHPDGRRVYANVSAPDGSGGLVCYDAQEETVLFRVTGCGGAPRVTPDGREVWCPSVARGDTLYSETIAVYDANNGTELARMPLQAYRVQGTFPVLPGLVRFLPSGDKAYVRCGSDIVPGPLLVIDVHGREVTKAFFLEEQRPSGFMDLGPAP